MEGRGALSWSIARGPLEPHVVAELRDLWKRDREGSPFASPAYLEGMARRHGAESVLALGRAACGSLEAVWPLRFCRGRRLRFLQEEQGDHVSCVAGPAVERGELAAGLEEAIRSLGARSASLQPLPSFGPSLAAARLALVRSGWLERSVASSACPVLAVDAGADADERFLAEVKRHRRVRSYANKLARQDGFEFEVEEGDGGLDEWARDFFDAHEWRWDATDTPSQFRFRVRRDFVRQCLEDWARDGILVRFAIRLRAGRVALVAGVRHADRLVYHLVATSPAGAPHRAGHVLIRRIGLWMAEQGLRTLDFGIGGEGYKLRYANGEEKLWRVYGARGLAIATRARAATEATIRGSPRLQAVWDSAVNRGLRGRLASAAIRARIRLRTLRRVHLAAPPRVLWAMLAMRVTGPVEVFYRARGLGEGDDGVAVELETFDALELVESEQGLLPAGRAAYLGRVFEGERPVGVVWDGRVVHVTWVGRSDEGLLPSTMARKGAEWCLRGVVTARSARGHGLFRAVLLSLRRRTLPHEGLLIYTYDWNRAARRAIERAGFERIGVRRTSPRGRVRFDPEPRPGGGAGRGPEEP